MEKITTYNYEAFYLDYLEDNLSNEGKQMLFDFLNQHPNLKAELELNDDVLEYQLSTDFNATLNQLEKENLKHCEDNSICLKNVDGFIIADIENQISVDKKQELNQFIKQHQLQQKVFAYQSTKLKPNLAEVYPNKSELKHQTKIIPLLIKITAVAALLLLLFTVINFNSTNQNTYQKRQANYHYKAPTLDVNTNHFTSPNKVQPQVEPIAKTTKSNQQKANFSTIKLKNQTVKKDDVIENPHNDIAEQMPMDNNVIVDSSSTNKPKKNTAENIKDTPQNNDNIATTKQENNSKSNIKLVDMYQPVTQLANNYTSLNVIAKKSTPESEYQVTKFSVGKFYFERKKKK